ncbi:MAG TPA: TlpA disulfide reductase family protein [Terriglobales bacterium]|nr:TlpA disulfide reductase family protein [Terriglobales bacterium]
MVNVYYIEVRPFTIALACAAALLLSGCYAHSKPTDINIPAPDFTIKDADHSVSLSQFRGKIVVLNFWATWCPPCIEEMPSLVGLQKKVRGTDVTILAVSVDDDADDYHKFLKDHNVDFLTVREAGQKTDTGVIAPVSSKYGTYKVPETYIIDRNGIIRRKFIGAVDWNQEEIVEYLRRLKG